jgi:putative ABC transport system permease protein
MFLLKLIIRNLLRQTLRSVLTLTGLVIAIAAFCLLNTVVEAWYSGVTASSATRLVTRHAVSLTFSLPISYRDKLARMEGVTGVAHATWFGGIYIDAKNFFPKFAVPAADYLAVVPEFVCSPDQKSAFLRDRKGAMVGRKIADQYGWKPGDTVPLRGTLYSGQWSFTVRCIYQGADAATDETQFFFHWDYLNETLKQRGDQRANTVGIFLTRIRDSGQAADISSRIDQNFRNSLGETLTETEKAFQLSFVAMTQAIVQVIQVVSVVIIVIIMAVMANTMAMTARERSREYATLRALGFGTGFIVRLVLGESLCLASLGGALGILICRPVIDSLGHRFGALFPVFQLSTATVQGAMLAALVIGLTAALFPVWKAARINVTEGLRTAL